jgi:MscS family membrane protein
LSRAGWRAAALCALLVLTAAARPQVHAAEPNPSPSSATTADAETAASRQPVPEDRWNRGTPRGALRSFLDLGREGNWQDAAQIMDLSAITKSEVQERGPELARQLKFLLDREEWIDLDQVSDDSQGSFDDGLPQTRESVAKLARVQGGMTVFMDREPREDGELIWRISSATVTRIPSVYTQFGLPKFVDELPHALRDTHFLEAALWQWIGLILLIVAAWFVAWLISGVVVRVTKPLTLRTETDVDDRLLALMVGPVRLLISVGVFNAGLHLLLLSVPANDVAREASKFLVIAGVAWFVLRVIDLFATITKERFVQRGQSGAAHLVPLGARTIKVAVVLLTILATLDTFGFDVTAIVAGLGVGGLAVALAAQKTVENIFGGVSVLIDQPVRPGDYCKFGDQAGTVEDIGLRSTRIRTLDRTVVAVPNADFSTMRLENFTKRDRILLTTTLGLRYETTPDQLRHVIAGLRGILLAHPKVLPDPLRVRLVGFGVYSIDLEMLAYVDTMDFNEFLAVREDIFLRVMDVIAASGSGFAFPSSTTYFARDRGLDTERQAAAEAEIQKLRGEGRLMFPNSSPEEVRDLSGTLDWPPRGSVSAKS